MRTGLVPTALPTQKAEGHMSVTFATEMLAMKPGKPNQTLDLKITPKEKHVSAFLLSA